MLLPSKKSKEYEESIGSMDNPQNFHEMDSILPDFPGITNTVRILRLTDIIHKLYLPFFAKNEEIGSGM